MWCDANLIDHNVVFGYVVLHLFFNYLQRSTYWRVYWWIYINSWDTQRLWNTTIWCACMLFNVTCDLALFLCVYVSSISVYFTSTCVYMYVCTCMCVYMYVCVHVCVCVLYMCVHVCVCMYMYVCVYMYVCLYMYVCDCVYMYVCTCIYVYMCMCDCMYM